MPADPGLASYNVRVQAPCQQDMWPSAQAPESCKGPLVLGSQGHAGLPSPRDPVQTPFQCKKFILSLFIHFPDGSRWERERVGEREMGRGERFKGMAVADR